MAQKFELPLADQFGLAVASIFIVLGFALAFIEDKHTAEEPFKQYEDAPTEQSATVEADRVAVAGQFDHPFLYRLRI